MIRTKKTQRTTVPNVATAAIAESRDALAYVGNLLAVHGVRAQVSLRNEQVIIQGDVEGARQTLLSIGYGPIQPGAYVAHKLTVGADGALALDDAALDNLMSR